MIPFLSPFILRLIGGKLKRLADVLAVISIIAVLVGGWNLWLHFHDKDVVKDYEAGVQADVVDTTTKAEVEADAAAAKYEADFIKKQAKEIKEIQDAKDAGNSPFDSWNDNRRVQPAAGEDRKAPR